MAASDWLFEVGVDTTKADATLKEFVSRSTKILQTIPSVNLRVNTSTASADVSKFVKGANASLAGIRRPTLKLDTQKAVAQVAQLRQQIANLGAQRVNVGGIGAGTAPGAISAATREIESQTKAVDFLTRAWSYSLLKFAEYEVIAKGIEGTIHELSDSLKQASDIQFEQTMQKLYAPKVFSDNAMQAKSLQNAIDVARTYGADIRDVVQVQGMWTKQTQDLGNAQDALAAATYLAADAEKMHRASGIETLEVYRLTNAMMNQLGGTARDIPRIYDQIAEAALHMNTALNNVSGRSKTEAFKDLFEGAAESAATLRAMHFSDDSDRAAGTLAIVANQVNQVGENGRTAAKNLTSMFAALEGRGNGAKTFESILGKAEDYKDFDQVIQAMRDHSGELFQAYRNGDLGVKPQQFETLQTFLESLNKIKSIYDDIRKNSAGKLDLVSAEQMDLLRGQADATRASFQAFTLAIGKELLPTALQFTHYLGSELAPELTKNAALIVTVGKALAELGVAIVALQGLKKLGVTFAEVSRAEEVFQLTTNNARLAANALIASGAPLSEAMGALSVANLKTSGSMQEMMAQAEREKAVLAQLAEQANLTKWQIDGFAAACQKAGVSMAEVSAVAGAGPSKLGAFASGIGSIGMAAARQLGPLAAMLVVMNAITSASSESGRLQGAIDYQTHQYEATHGNVGDRLKGTGYALTDAVKGEWLSDDKGLNEREYALSRDKGDAGHQYRLAVQARDAAKKSGNMDAFDAAQNEIGNLVQQANLTKPLSSTGNLTNDIQAILAKLKFQGASPEADYNKAAKSREHDVDPEMQLRKDFESQKREEQGDLSLYQARIRAMQSLIEAAKKVAEQYGWTTESINHMARAYKQQELAAGSASLSAQHEADLLATDEKKAEARVKATAKRPNSNAHQSALTNLSMIQEAWKKATGAAEQYRAMVDRIAADEKLSTDKARVEAGVEGLHWRGITAQLTNAPRTLADYRDVAKSDLADIDLGRKSTGLAGGLSNADFDLAQMEAYRAGLQKLYDTLKGEGVARNALTNLAATIHEFTSNIADGKSKVEEFRTELDNLTNSASDIFDKTFAKNESGFETLGLGDPANAKAIQDYLSGLKSINDEYHKLDDISKQIGTTNGTMSAQDAARVVLAQNRVAAARQELAIQQQMLPVLEREEEIRASIAYKATNSVLDKYGSAAIGKDVDHLFGDTGKRGDDFSHMLADWTKQVAGEWWSTTAKSLTDGLFGVQSKTQEQRLADLYATHVAGETQAAKLMLQASENNLRAVGVTVDATTGSLAGSLAPNGQSIQVTDDQGNSLPTSIDAAPNHQLIADNTSAMVTSLSTIAGAVGGSGAGATATGTTGSGGLGSLIGGSATPSLTNVAQALGTLGGLGGVFGTTNNGGKNGAFSQALGTIGASASGLGGYLNKAGQASGNYDEQIDGQLLQAGGGVVSGLGTAYSGVQQGGLSGGLETGLGIFSAEASINPALAASPVGIGIAAAGGLYSMFSHHDDPASMPDKYNTAVYGQDIANLTGKAGANGTSFSEDYNLQSQLGGLDQIQYIEEYLAKGRPSDMTNQQYANAMAEFGSSSTGAGVLNHDAKNIGMVDVSGASGTNGKEVSYTQLEQDASSIISQALTKQTLAPIISMNAYGLGLSGAGMNPNNLIGLTPSEQAAMVANQYKTLPTSQYQQSPYATPGVGTAAPGSTASNPVYTKPAAGSTPVQVTTQLVVNGQVLATAVNAYNTAQANRSGSLAA